MKRKPTIKALARAAAEQAVPDLPDLGMFTQIQRMKRLGYEAGWEAGYRAAMRELAPSPSDSGENP